MSGRRFILFFVFIVAIDGKAIQQSSEECPGNLKWSSTATTIIGGIKAPMTETLLFPEGLFIEPKTQILYIADVSANYVWKYYPNGKMTLAAGHPDGKSGSTSDRLDGPRDAFADENENVYVSDWSNQRVQLWKKNAKNGTTVAGNGHRGSSLSELSYPSRVWVDSHKNVLVADTQNQRVTQWPTSSGSESTNATVTAGGNGAGINPYQLNTPMGIYLDELNGIIYISNEESHSVTQWVIGTYMDRNIYAGIPGRPGSSSAQLSEPQGIILDSYGNLYVTDCNNHRIQFFCPNSVFGITIGGTGKIGNGSNELYFPRDIALDADFNLYVSDTYNQRIQKFARI